MKVELAAEAEEQILRVDEWWREHRSAAPDLFSAELQEALQALARVPGIGVSYAAVPGLRRMLLRRTRYHLYFVTEPARVLVLAVWSARRGRGPRL